MTTQDPGDHRAAGLTDAFLATMAGMLGLVAALFVVSVELRLGAEESGRLAEPVPAHSVGHLRRAAGHLAIAFGGSALILLLGGLGLGIGHGAALAQTVGGTLTQLPAAWVTGAVAALLYGAAPGCAPAGAAPALGWIGTALILPRAVLDPSPFARLPRIPGSEALSWEPLLSLTTLAVTLLAAALIACAPAAP